MKIATGQTFISIFILCIGVALPTTRVASFGEAVVRQGPPPGPLKFEVASIKPSKAGEPQTGGFCLAADTVLQATLSGL